MLGQRRFGKLQTALLVIIALVIGANLVSPAVGHVTKKLKHLYKHLDPRYVNVGEKAGDADTLDAQDSTQIGSRVASGYSASPSGSLLASTSITVPANGYLVLNGIANIDIGGGSNDFGSCVIEVNGVEPGGFAEYDWTLDSVESDQDHCNSHGFRSVTPGTYTVELFVSGLAGTSTAGDGRVTALYVPYGPTGTRP